MGFHFVRCGSDYPAEYPTRPVYKAEIRDDRLVAYPYFVDLVICGEPVDIEECWIGFGNSEGLQEVLYDGRINVDPVEDIETLRQMVLDLQAEIAGVKAAQNQM